MERCIGVEWELEQICDVSLLTNNKSSNQRCIGVEWELEQISNLSLLTNQVLKVVYSYFKSSPEQHDTANRCINTSHIVKIKLWLQGNLI